MTTTVEQPPPFNAREVILRNWIPALITAVVGGVTLAFVVPYVQVGYANESAMKQRQVQLWETLALDFTQYINARSRLNSAARAEQALLDKGEPVSAEFLRRKDEYRAQRDESNVRLRGELLKAEFYFGDDVKELSNQYVKWHSAYAIATVDKLPSDSEYLEWRQKILTAIGAKLKTSLGGA